MKNIYFRQKNQGPDHKAGLNPNEFKAMVKNIRIIEKMLGSKTKKVTRSEKKNIKIVRKSLVALKK